MKNRIYADNAATTRTKKEVLEAMLPYLSEEYGNPSSIYSFSNNPKKAIEKAREQTAAAIGAKSPREITFVSCATEADNWAIKGIAHAYRNKGNHIISTKIEHHAVLHTLKALEKEGFDVTYLDVDENGLVSVEDFKNAVTDKTILASIIFVNNEIGTIQPIEELAVAAKERGVIFHTDAVQAIGHLPVNVQEMNIDLLSMSAHKFYGPKGVGAMYMRSGIRIFPYMDGGAQESKRRGGTENVAGIVGLGKAIEIACTDIENKSERLRAMRDRLIERVLNEIPYCRLNGDREKRVCSNANFSFRFIEGEALLLHLDLKGISASSGSACTSGSLDPSHVLLAIGLPHEIAHGSLRISFGDFNEESDVDRICDALKEIVQLLRNMSPLYEEFERSNK